MKKVIQKFKVDNDEIVFRYPEQKDVKEMLNLVNSLFIEKAMIGENEKPKLKDIKESLKKKMFGIKNKKVVYLVVLVNGELRGRAWISKKRDTQNHIGNLAIHIEKEIRRKGIGDKLLKAILKEAKKVLKIKIIFLEVVAQNKSAIKLYQRNGFVKNGLLKGGINHFGKLVDDIYMAKYL